MDDPNRIISAIITGGSDESDMKRLYGLLRAKGIGWGLEQSGLDQWMYIVQVLLIGEDGLLMHCSLEDLRDGSVAVSGPTLYLIKGENNVTN